MSGWRILGGVAMLGGLVAAQVPVEGVDGTGPVDPPAAEQGTGRGGPTAWAWRRDTVRLAEGEAEALGVRVEAARPMSHPGTLVAHGRLAMDPLVTARVRPRFSGVVAEHGTRQADDPGGPLRSGDPVAEGQVLAVVYSSRLSEEKNDLLGLLSELRLERESFARVEALRRDQAVAEQEFRVARRELEDAEIDAARAERSLRARGVTEEEIAKVRGEAEVLRDRRTRSEFDQARSWGRFGVRAPIAGALIESRFAVGEVVETEEVMFVVSDLGRLEARVRVDERDLDDVEALPRPIRWVIRPVGWPEGAAIEGAVESLGAVVDADTRAATLAGPVPNPEGRLRPGQSITATLELPADPSLVELPLSARLDGEDGLALIFIQAEPDEPIYRLRPVRPARACESHLVLRVGTEDGVRPGERVVVAGAARLKAILDEPGRRRAEDRE